MSRLIPDPIVCNHTSSISDGAQLDLGSATDPWFYQVDIPVPTMDLSADRTWDQLEILVINLLTDQGSVSVIDEFPLLERVRRKSASWYWSGPVENRTQGPTGRKLQASSLRLKLKLDKIE